jgi:hypothetical protein
MMMYLLLRDNKQSGPFSLDELKTLGLKAYDLVWVDGRSAAWRYPSELEELRPFAPMVEEQPFDRFYKKPSPAKAVVAAVVASRAGMDTENISQVSSSPALYAGEPSVATGKRIIYVTMPAGKSTGVLREGVPVRTNNRITEERTPDPKAHEKTGTGPDGKIGTGPDEKIGTGPYEKLSHVPEDWKNHVEIIPHVKRRHSSRIWQPVAVVLSILALLAAGIFIGLSINKETFGIGKKIAVRNAVPDNGQRLEGQALQQQLPVAAATTSPVPVPQPSSTDSLLRYTPGSSASGLSASQGPVTNAQTAGRQHPPRQFSPKEKSAGNSRNQAALAASTRDSASISIPIVHREATHRTDLPADKNDNVDKDVIKNNIANLVSVGTKGYTVGTFGGISALQLTVSNHSVYPLDLVVVEVQYIQANKKVFKTENLYFRGIGPGAALMQEAPKSARGIKVQYKITMVNSKELGLSYSGI